MAQRIVIAELDIDVQQLLRSTSDLRREIDRVRNTQRDLTASGEETSEAFIQNAAVLRSLNSAYTSNVRALSESGQATAQQADRTQMLSLALNQEVTSISEARQQNALLNRLRNETNTTTAEGQDQLARLNQRLNQNNDFIRENGDALTRQRMNVGNYSDSIREAASSINPLNGGLAGFAQRAQDAGGVLPLVKTGLMGVISGIGGMISASLAFIATPIGAIIAAIALTLGILVSVFKTFQPVVDKAEQAVAAIGSALNVVKNTILAVVTGTKSLSDAFSGLGGSMSNAAKEAANLTKAQQDLDDVMQAQEVTTAKNRAEINRLNVQLKDRTKTEKERLAISDQIIKKEQADFEQRKKIVDEEVRIARGQIAVKAQFTAEERKLLKEQGIGAKELAESKGGNYDAEFEALNKARLKAIALENEVSVNLEKQYVKRNKIEDEAQANADRAKAASEKAAQDAQTRRQKEIDDLIAKSNIQIELFKTAESVKQKTALETADFEKQLFEKENANLKLQYDKGKISKEQFELSKLQLSQNYAKQQADTLLQFANAELNLFLQNNKSKLIGAETLTSELVAEEDRRLKLIEQKRIENLAREKGIDVAKIEAKKLNNEQLTVAELEFETERIKIASETDATIQANKKTLEEQIKAQKAEQLAIDKEVALAEAETKAEEDAIKAEADYQTEMDRLNKLLTDKKITEEQFAALKKSADAKTAENERIAALNRTQAQLQEFQKVGAGLEGLFGKNKAISSATALINGGLAVTEILKTPSVLPEPAASISRAIQIAGTVATTARSIAQINGAKFEKGGIQEIGGKRHSAGGTKFWGEDGTQFEAEAGEGIGILNRNAFASFMDFNNSHLGGRSNGGFFQGGGIITQGVRPETLNIDSVVDAIASMPAPVVAVEEIQTVGNRYTNVVSGANL
jgi:predicted  nucleic acid-binding Zn-ribbon protein